MNSTDLQTASYMLKFVLFWASVFVVAAIIFWLRSQYKAWRQRRIFYENEYEIKYYWLKRMVDEPPFTTEQFNYLKDQIAELSRMKHKNLEKTEILRVRLSLGRFRDIALSEARKRDSRK